MTFAYYDRLSAARKRIYLQSDGIHVVKLPAPGTLAPLVARVDHSLRAEHRDELELACQRLANGICDQIGVRRARIKLLAVRPRADWGELHGLYEAADGRTPEISLWMRTAQQRRTVAFRTFLRTLLHELCHHLDFEHLKLPETFHTEGFYKRESSLLNQLAGPPAPRKTVRGPAGR
ncbi:MAG: hypothetical protein IT515_05545 [Burkholderiales bacterium]|nr:hypothetical protein [Burkholderiales bacterium]